MHAQGDCEGFEANAPGVKVFANCRGFVLRKRIIDDNSPKNCWIPYFRPWHTAQHQRLGCKRWFCRPCIAVTCSPSELSQAGPDSNFDAITWCKTPATALSNRDPWFGAPPLGGPDRQSRNSNPSIHSWQSTRPNWCQPTDERLLPGEHRHRTISHLTNSALLV